MKPGQLWENHCGPYNGRRGRIVSVGEKVTLAPAPGFCQCPRKQRTTSIAVDRFRKEWVRIVEHDAIEETEHDWLCSCGRFHLKPRVETAT